MMVRTILILAFLTCGSLIASGAPSAKAYWIYFTDKPNSAFDPYSYFDSHAIDRRNKQDLPLFDQLDLPVNREYLDVIKPLSDTVGYASRWLNAVYVRCDTPNLSKIRQLPFVSRIESANRFRMVFSEDNVQEVAWNPSLAHQVNDLGYQEFRQAGFDGSGIRIAVLDGGFPDYTSHPALAHLIKQNRIKATWDFTKDREDVDRGVQHGTNVLSNIGGIWQNSPMGLATGAEFLLAITEVRTEPYAEEQNWLAAVEWADKNGADIINSSLGYTYHRYFPEEMDGSSLVARAANIAARKGILVVNSAGNSGSDDEWKIISTPADADSVLAVGGTNPLTGYHIDFSSYGPTADNRMKPNVTAYGRTVVAKKGGGIGFASGTSFSSPLLAGFAACAWQAQPDLTNMELFEGIERSGSLYPYYDYAHGFGTPTAMYFLAEIPERTATFGIGEDDGNMVVQLKPLDSKINDKQEADEYLYYHIADSNGKLLRYFVHKIETGESFVIPKSHIPEKPGMVIRVHFMGYTQTFTTQ